MHLIQLLLPLHRNDGQEEGEAVAHDAIVVHEVMGDALDRGWWARYRRDLEQRFGQEQLVVRAQAIELP